MAVVFAMMSSYFLSRTLVPTMVHHLLGAEVHLYDGSSGGHSTRTLGFTDIHERFNVHFERLRRRLRRVPRLGAHQPKIVTIGFAVFVALSLGVLFPALGKDFFPSVDAGQMKLHVRMPAGHAHRGHRARLRPGGGRDPGWCPKKELATVLDNIGVPVSGINLALGDSSMISSGRRRDPTCS